MAVNPPVSDDGIPMAVVGESYLLVRTGMKLETLLIASHGVLFLTTRRICFVANKPAEVSGLNFAALDIPLSHLVGEEFKQPIFGANRLEGLVNPLPDMGLTGPFKFKLQFREGGVTTFLRFFFQLMETQRKATEDARRAFFAGVASGSVARAGQAYLDPSDPSKLYVTQPVVPTAPEAYTAGYPVDPAAATRVGYAPVPSRSVGGAAASATPSAPPAPAAALPSAPPAPL